MGITNPADILIVDDVPENLDLLGTVLRAEGYKVRPAPSGKLALRAAESLPPDLIMLDINMPEMDGYEVCSRLKENPELESIPVIFISGLSETLDKVQAFGCGGVDYVTKPFESREVLARVKVHCELRQIQRVLEIRNAELEQTLARLKDAQMQLIQSEKMASLGVLTAGVAHEINNPINFICAGTKGLQKVMEEFREVAGRCALANFPPNGESVCLAPELVRISGEMEELSGSIATGAHRAATIAAGLRTFSRLDESEKKVTNLNENIDSALLMLSHRCKEGVSLVKNFGEVPLLLCYPGKLNQVFLNCLSNALDAVEEMPPNHPREVRIKTGVEEVAGIRYACVVIDDTGPGIAEKEQTHLFDPFFTTKEVGKGVGLGLSISHGIIQDHGGSIEIGNLPGRGAVVRILLPLHESEKEDS
jgi:signal transduction histidine kinase